MASAETPGESVNDDKSTFLIRNQSNVDQTYELAKYKKLEVEGGLPYSSPLLYPVSMQCRKDA